MKKKETVYEVGRKRGEFMKENGEMKELLDQIDKRVVLLRRAIKKAETKESSFPEGSLRVSPSRSTVRYYHMLRKGDTTGTYIPQKDKKKIVLLAQKAYNRQFLDVAKRELEILKETMDHLRRNNADEVFRGLAVPRRELVTPYIQTDELFAQEWKEKSYIQSRYREEEKKYEARNGEKVRSKSEAILADTLCELGIPYRYEQVLKLKSGQVRYPDFTLLKVRTREEFYLEHFGMLDEDEYRRHNLQKLDEYRDNGIYPGKNLLITYETADSPLDIIGIKKMLKELLI